MNQQNTVESRVLSILKDCPRARFDDMILIMHYYNRYATYLRAGELPLNALAFNYKVYGLPCFETIRRARQRVQSLFPEYSRSANPDDDSMVISDLSYEQIVEKHAPVVKQYIPFLLLSKAAGEVFAEFKRNEDKFFKRMQRDDSYGFDDGTTELYNAGICVPDFTGELFEEEKDSRIVWAAFARLTPTQKKYVRQHLFGGKTFTRIAKDEGKSIKTVQEAYIAAIKKMKKFLKTPSNLDS